MMAIEGRKERALTRRGYHIKESLSRRIPVNENAFNRRMNEEQLSLFDEPKEIDKNKIIDLVDPSGKFKSKKFRDFILEGSGVYPKCSPVVITTDIENVNKPCVGKIDTENCQTGLGIIGGNYSAESRGGVGEWSVINFFDTNDAIHKTIVNIYENSKSELSLNDWINVNIKELIGDKGLYTGILADIILTKDSGSRYKGNKNEEVIIDALTRAYPGIVINRFCDGDERDRINGQDIMVTYKNKTKYIQVKPLYGYITINTLINGDVFFEIPIYKDITEKYSPENIQMLAFVSDKDYIVFDYVDGMYEQVANTKAWGPKAPKFILKFKNDPKLKSTSLKIKYVNELDAIPEDEKLKIFEKKIKYYESLINDSKVKIKHLTDEIQNLKK